MAATPTRSHKHFRLDSRKIKRAQTLLRTGTETETIERALDLVISEHEKNRLTVSATKRFLAGRATIKDVYRKLES